jgi:hypothetical protein
MFPNTGGEYRVLNKSAIDIIVQKPSFIITRQLLWCIVMVLRRGDGQTRPIPATVPMTKVFVLVVNDILKYDYIVDLPSSTV